MRVKEILATVVTLLLTDLVIGQDQVLREYTKVACSNSGLPQLDKNARYPQYVSNYVDGNESNQKSKQITRRDARGSGSRPRDWRNTCAQWCSRKNLKRRTCVMKKPRTYLYIGSPDASLGPYNGVLFNFNLQSSGNSGNVGKYCHLAVTEGQMTHIAIRSAQNGNQPGRIIKYAQTRTSLTFGVMANPQRGQPVRDFSFTLKITGLRQTRGMSAVCCDQ